ncbi:hypothetical protein RhiirA4_469287 [Rhizophagus irregularis]|uniref:Replication origin-binding protein domain-containing protein n=1 Tax=Rhizophagus irregularis TaxID=588596 RepID=A0A2I1GZ87_9GLOM|nr:hypothetical protein RhiirA4_469287 [Rhizophagus irregularis]
MHTPTISDQTDHTGTAPALRYDGASPDEYLSDSNSYSENESDLGSDDYNDYESNYELDNEEAPCASTSITETPLVQPSNTERDVNATYTLRQEKFNDKFSPKDLLNAFRKIFLSPPKDMSDEKGSLEYLPIYSFLFPNEKGSSLYNAYDRGEVENKLVIKIDQDDRAPKFSVADDISEVYGLPGIHEYINGQKPLRAVINIDASQKDMETTGVKAQEVFIRICCSFIRALYRILDCNWEDILKGLVIATSSDHSKCSYHILYAPVLLVDHHELKSFTELVYTITGEKFGMFIDRKLSGHNFNFRLIGSAKKGRVKRILQFSLDNGWNELDHVRVQPPSNLGLKDILQKCADLVLQKYSNYLRDWTIEEKDSENFVYFNRKALLECPQCKRIHDKDQRWFGRVCASSGKFIVKCFWQNSDERGEVFECDPSIAEKIQQENKNSLQSSHKVKAPGFPKAFVKMPSWVKYNDPLTATETYEERYVRPLPDEGDIYVGSPWETGKTYVLEHLTIADDRVVCQIESLHRIANNCKCNKKCKCPPIQYDLWLDEIVSIIAQAQSRLAGQSIEKLYKLIQEARQIIVMDNDLTNLNIEWIKALRKDKLFSIIHNTFQPQKGKTFCLTPNKEIVLAELWGWARQISSLPSEKRTSASLICHLRKDVQGIVRALKTDFPELRIKEYHGKSDPVEKAHDFSNVEDSWRDIDLVAYTSTLKIGVSCTNPKFERAFCLFNSYIETNAGTNQMLFCMRCIKDYVCHIEQKSSIVPVTEKGLFQWLLNAKRECLPQELQNRGIFPDINSIIRNKDVPSVRLWVAFMLEKFRSRQLFGWRMVDFLRKAGMIISIIESILKPEDTTTSLSQIVKASSSIVKAEEISNISNATIVDHETAEFLENKPKKTLEEMRSLDWHHIVECYEISPELLTEYFISKYGSYNHMRWFRAYRQLRDAGTNNEKAVEAITRKDYRDDKLAVATRAERHRICLELLRICTPARDIDDRTRYRADDTKTRLNSPESISYLQDLIPKMARVFDNTDASRSAKKSGLKTDRAKLGLLNSALHAATYGLKFKAVDRSRRYYRLDGSFDTKDAPRLPSYQTGEEIYWENGEDTRYGYSKLPPDELILDNFTSSSKKATSIENSERIPNAPGRAITNPQRAEPLITTLSPSILTQIESVKSLLNESANSCKEAGNKCSWIEALLSSDSEIGASGILG